MRTYYSIIFCLFMAHIAVAQSENTEADACEINEFIELATSDIEALKGTKHGQAGLFGTGQYWDATRTYEDAKGKVYFDELADHYYAEYIVEEDLDDISGEVIVSMYVGGIQHCLGSDYIEQEVTYEDNYTVRINNKADEGTLFLEHPYVEVALVANKSAYDLVITIFLPQ